jgi:hypothetical protein
VRRDQLEHGIRAATDVLREDSIIIIGSQSVLGSVDDNVLPPQVLLSMEIDVLPIDDDAETKADAVDGAIGEGSIFHETHGVGERLASTELPRDDRSRISAWLRRFESG